MQGVPYYYPHNTDFSEVTKEESLGIEIGPVEAKNVREFVAEMYADMLG